MLWIVSGSKRLCGVAKYYGRGSKCLVRYDNAAGKGDDRHVKGREELYRVVSVAKLRRDFEAGIRKYGGDNEEED